MNINICMQIFSKYVLYVYVFIYTQHTHTHIYFVKTHPRVVPPPKKIIKNRTLYCKNICMYT